MKTKNISTQPSSPMTIKEFLDFAISVSAALVDIHKKGHSYGAICPENISWQPENLKAEFVDLSNSDKKPLLDKACLPYISPEQTGRMNRRVDYRTDLYSLGIVFYEMLVGEPPFVADDTLEMIHLHIASVPPTPHAKLAEIPVQISNIIVRLLQKNADDRYQSAFGLEHDLEECAWQRKQNGSIKQFELGKSDLTGIFRIPQKLYGREKELRALLDSFERISTGATELFMVAGYSGVGKSVLAREVQKPITAKRGFFVEGKFDQYQRNIPYFAWQQAFSTLVKHLLMESDDRLADWKKRVQEAISPNGKVITDVIRNLELVIGQQPEVPTLGAMEAQNRFNSVFQNFIKTLADKEHPLVIFLDDLHWIDSASLNLLQVLVTDPDLSHVQFIGAYRDNEVDAAHPLIVFLESLKEEQAALKQIALQNLLEEDVNALIADTLQSSCEETRQIAKLINSKTAGNAFFTHQILHTLNNENLLVFDAAARRWNWDMETLRALNITENVVELLSTSMRKLPVETQEVLKLAACIGNLFGLDTLSLVERKKRNEVEGKLNVALLAGIIFPLNDHYKFAHDRLQQAAYSLIPEEIKKETHLEIGRIMLDTIPKDNREERIFDIVNHLNIGFDFIKEPSEHAQLAQLNLMAGRRAKQSTAYESALRYFALGIELLGTNAWETEYQLILDLSNDAAEATFLLSMDSKMEELSQTVFSNARNISDKMKVIDIAISNELKFGRFDQAIEMGLKYLKELDLNLNPAPSTEEADLVLAESIELMQNKSVEQLINLSKLDDPRLANQIHIIRSLTDSLAFFNWNLLITSCSTAIQLLVRHGNTKEAPLVYAYYSYILTNINTRQYEVGHLAAKVAVGLLEIQSLEAMKCPVLHITNTYLFQNFGPLKDIIKQLFDTYHIGMEQGNLVYATYCAGDGIVSLVSSGVKLGEVLDKLEWYMPFAKKNKLIPPFFYCLPVVVYAKYLGNPEICQFDEEQFWQLKKEESSGMGELITHVHRLLDIQFLQSLAIHFGQYNEAINYGEEAHECAARMSGSFATQRIYFLDTIACLRSSETTDQDRKKLLAQRIERHMSFLKRWAELAPMNFAHMLYLAKAESARISDQPESAATLYEQAIKAARENGFIQDCALSYDLAADYYKQYGFEEIYRTYKLKAHEVYEEWGALALVKHLENQNPHLFVTEPSQAQITPKPVQLDLNTVIKASEAISGEISLDKLLAKMMHIVIENAGAQKGFLILARGSKWVIEAIADVDKSKVQVLQSINIEGNDKVSAGIIHYVARTQEAIVLVDAINEGEFTSDDTIQHRQSRSVLCTPLINQGQISGILYLENNLTAGVFTSERVELLKLLSSQMAMALDNAQIYLDLEQSEKRFRATFEQAAVGIAHVSPGGKFMRINQMFCNLVGYSYDEMLKLTFQEITHPEDLEADLGQLSQLLSGGIDTYSMEKRYIHKKGDFIWISLTVSLVRNEAQHAQWFVAVVKDISERKQATENLLKSEEKNRELAVQLNTIFEASPVAEVIVDGTGRINLVNKEAENIFGYDRDEMIGQFIEMLLPKPNRVNHTHLRAEYNAKPQRRRMGKEQKLFARHKDGSQFPIDVALSPTAINGEKMVLSAITDISERNFALEQTLKYQRRLKDLAREVTITEEVTRKQIAVDLHDHVGQLLASMRVQLASINKVEENPEIIGRVENISEVLRTAIQATRDAIFNLSLPQLNEIGLYAAVHDWMHEEIELKHNINTSISGEDEKFYFDENTRFLLFRSIRELMINVMKHAQATLLKIDFKRKNELLEISVQDDGIGFNYSPNLLRMKSNTYGLFSIQERLSDLGGIMTVDSEGGKGTDIKLLIPLKDDQP